MTAIPVPFWKFTPDERQKFLDALRRAAAELSSGQAVEVELSADGVEIFQAKD